MFNLPKRTPKENGQYAEEMAKKREAFISQAPLKEMPPKPDPSPNNAEQPKTEFTDFKIKKTEKPKITKPKLAPEKKMKNKIDTYVSDDVLQRFNTLCQKEQRTQAAMLRIILIEYLENRG